MVSPYSPFQTIPHQHTNTGAVYSHGGGPSVAQLHRLLRLLRGGMIATTSPKLTNAESARLHKLLHRAMTMTKFLLGPTRVLPTQGDRRRLVDQLTRELRGRHMQTQIPFVQRA